VFPAAYPPGCTMANLSGCVPATSFTAEPNRTYYDWSLTPMGTPVRTITLALFPHPFSGETTVALPRQALDE
jgi:hypothetical protein